MPGLQDFAADVIVKVFTNEDVQKALKELFGDLVTEKILPLLPLLAASAAAALGEKFQQTFAHVLDADPDIPIVSDIFDLSETVRSVLNGHPEINIPILGDLLKGMGGK